MRVRAICKQSAFEAIIEDDGKIIRVLEASCLEHLMSRTR